MILCDALWPSCLHHLHTQSHSPIHFLLQVVARVYPFKNLFTILGSFTWTGSPVATNNYTRHVATRPQPETPFTQFTELPLSTVHSRALHGRAVHGRVQPSFDLGAFRPAISNDIATKERLPPISTLRHSKWVYRKSLFSPDLSHCIFCDPLSFCSVISRRHFATRILPTLRIMWW